MTIRLTVCERDATDRQTDRPRYVRHLQQQLASSAVNAG